MGNGRSRPHSSRTYRVGSTGAGGKKVKYHTRQYRSRLLNVTFVPKKGSVTSWNKAEVRHRGKLGTWIDLSKTRKRRFANAGPLYNSLSSLTGENLMKYEQRARPTLKQATTIGVDFNMRKQAVQDWAKLYAHGNVKSVNARIHKHGFRGRGPGHDKALRRMYGTAERRLPIVRPNYAYVDKSARNNAIDRRISRGGKDYWERYYPAKGKKIKKPAVPHAAPIPAVPHAAPIPGKKKKKKAAVPHAAAAPANNPFGHSGFSQVFARKL